MQRTSRPFYIPKTIRNLEWHGGFEDIVTGPFGAEGFLHGAEAADYGPDYHPDVLKEIQESWLLLMPGDFYGGTLRLHTALVSPRTYNVVGRRCPPRLTDELQGQLANSPEIPSPSRKCRFEARFPESCEVNGSMSTDETSRGKATIAIEIRAGFAENLEKGQTAPVQVIVDGTNSNTALIALGYVNQIAVAYARQYQQERIGRTAPQLLSFFPQVQLEQRPWYNEDLKSRWFFVPGVIGSLTLVLVTVLTAFAVLREREIGTLEQIMVTPIRPSEFILGKTLPFFLIGLLDVSLIATVGTFWFQVPFRGNIFVLLTGAVLFLLCMLGVGLLISTVSSTQQQAMVTSFFFIMPAITFSGFGFPISTMPQWLQYLTYLSPLRYFLVVLRGTYLKGIGFDILWPQMLAMLLFGAGCSRSLFFASARLWTE